MCSKNSPFSIRRAKLISMSKKETTVRTLKTAHKTRTKTKKPKFLSLRLELSPENTQQSVKMATTTTPHDCRKHQLNLFPLHPESIVEDKETHDDNVANFFSTADGGATTLTALFGTSGSSSEDESPLPPPYAYRDSNEDGEVLVRTAMKNKERDSSEEKWVCYSEVVERKEEEVTSSAVDHLKQRNRIHQGLSLKLDYEEILNAWSQKGSLYIHAEPPQTVPDLHEDFLGHGTTNGPRDGWQNNGGLWSVPEMSGMSSSGQLKVKEEVEEEGDEWKMAHREASVLRYKQKRQNRLFSKRIRYEVRKLNAEKRPRVKGRFVKKN
ncbi:unnamed protein product [Ilex paraguariensis]|uniref:CCT domain-containing protein n=1 Tax=Ilex paraguariensis TaxID=185542 RepID=A0ABC8UHK6_9AQUA